MKGCALIFLTVCCRSNGLVNVGFACFPHFILLINNIISTWKAYYWQQGERLGAFHIFIFVLYRILAIGFIIVYVGLPYVLYQQYAGYLYCSTAVKPVSLSFLLPQVPSQELESFALQLGVQTPFSVNSSTIPDWCEGIPWSSYTRLQKQFWNVGPLNYYEWKQLPNFLLALPVLLIVLSAAQLYEKTARVTMVSLGVFAEHRRSQLVLPHIYHAVFLFAYGVINVHIQVRLCVFAPMYPHNISSTCEIVVAVLPQGSWSTLSAQA